MSVDLLPPPGEFRTTEEIRDAQYAQRLARRRKLMLAWSAPLVLIAFLAAVKVLSAVLLNMAGTSAYEKQNYVTATDRFSSLEFFNVIQPWKAPFNEGTAVYASGDFFGATTHLDVALGQVPTAPEDEPRGEEECMVRTNYSLALEGLGDEASIAADFAMATDYYEQAQTMLGDCGESGGNGGEQAEDAEERQQQSQEQSEEQQQQQEQGEGGEDPSESPSDGEQSESPSEGESGDQSESPSEGESGEQSESPSEGESGDQSASPSEGESSDPRQEELEERNQEAQESREAAEQQSGGGDGSGQNW